MELGSKSKEVVSGLSPIRDKIKSLLHTTRIDIFQILKIQAEIDTFEIKLKASNTDFKTYEEFMNSYLVEKIEVMDTSFHSTLCQNCNEVCHQNCDIDEMAVIGDQVFQQCWMIKNGNCGQCRDKCSHISHYRAKKIIKKNKKTIQDILSDMRIRHNQISDEKNNHRRKTISKEDATKILESALNQKNEETKQICMKLYQISACSDLKPELQIFIDLLDKEYTILKSITVGKQGTALIRSLKDLCNRMTNESDLITKMSLYTPSNDIESSNITAVSTRSNVRVKKTEKIHQLTGIDDEELKELLIDELLESQKALNSEISSEQKEASNRFAPIQNKIKSLLHTTRIDIFQVLKMQTEIDAFEIKLKASNTDFKTYEEFMNSYLVEKIEVMDTSFHSTLCQNCNEVCHENCDIDEMAVIGDQIFQQCWMIKNGNCRQCRDKCSHISHYRAKKIIKKNKMTIQDILSDMRIRHDQISDEKNNHRRKIISKEDATKILESALKEKIDGIKQLCIALYRICPDYEIAHELQVHISHLDRECTMLSNNDVKKRTNALIASLKDLYSTMSNDPRLLEKSLMSMTINHLEYSERTYEDVKSSNSFKKIEETQQSTIVESDTINNISVTESITYENSPDVIVPSEAIGATMKTKQEILDTSGMTKILIIGETGSGKSTFINYLTNYFYNGNLQNLHIAIPSKFHPCVTEKFVHCENDIHNTTQSKTDNCNQYMFSTDSKQYIFVDTPGLSDTRGAQQDDKNVAKIIDSVENLGGLTAVIIVVNGAVSRLTINLQNVLTRLRGNLPDAIMDNVIIVLTNVTRYAVNFSIDALELNGNVYPYYMQNSAFSQDPATRTSATLEAIQYDFDQSMNEIRNMMNTIDTFQTKSVIAFKTMKSIRSDIKALFHKAHLEVTQIQKLQDEINIFENLVKQCDSHLVTYKDYIEEREIDTTEIVDASVNSTLCGQCNQVCHENCQPDESTTTDAQFYSQCWVFRNGYCRRCVDKCSHTAHYYAKKTVKKSKKKIQTILNDIKSKYDQTWDEKNTYAKKITSKDDARKILETALKEKNEEIKQLCFKLRHICAGFNHTQELNVFIGQLETEETMLTSIEAKQQARVLIRSLKDLCNRMANDPELSAKPASKMNIINTAPSSSSQTNRTFTNFTKTPSSNNNLSSSQQNSVAIVPKPPLESDSCANDDVLAVIRAINKKKMTKSTTKKKFNMEVESDMKANKYGNDNVISMEDRNSKNESDNDERHNSATQNNTHESQSITIDSKDPRALSIDELIDCYNFHKGHPQANLIIFELVQRSLGKSMGPMKTPGAVADFTASIQKYSVLGINELMKEYETLKHRINSIIGSDIFKINQVPSNVLSEIAVAHMLLQSNSSIQNSSFNISSYQTHQSAELTHNRPIDHSFAPQQINSSMSITNLQSHSQNQLNASDGSTKLDSQLYVHPNIASPPTQQPLLDLSSNLHNTLDSVQQPYISTDSLQKCSPTTKHRSPTLDSIGSQRSSPRHSPSNFANIGDNHNNVGKMSTIRLISAYNDACARGNHEQTNLYYDELKRRCYGDYPTLIFEKQALFDEVCRTYQNRTLEDLKQNVLRIHQTIDSHLTDGNPAHINNIPKELIVESAALNHLISAKNS